jgi:hypothetical protein
VRRQQAALPAAVAEVRHALDAEAAEAERQAAALADQEAAKQRKLGALRTALGMYRDRLGLAFRHCEGEQLDVVFTRVDTAAPGREFRFGVVVLPDDTYEGAGGGKRLQRRRRIQPKTMWPCVLGKADARKK